MAPSFPPSGEFLRYIRKSSRDLRIASGVSITPEHIKRLLLSTAFVDSFKRVSAQHGLALPLQFSSHVDELNLLAILSLLNFASGYRVPLHVQTGRGAWDSIRAFVFSLYISSSEGNYLSAKGLRAIKTEQIAELMNINIHVETPHETIPGLTIGEVGGPLYALVKQIESVLNETGKILEEGGYPHLGAFVVEALERSQKERAINGDIVEPLLEKLVRAFPGFRDMAEVNGQPIYCFKKALFLIHAISIRFGCLSPPPFPVPSTSHIPVFSDNVLPSLLVHLGVIDLSTSPTCSSLFPDSGTEEKLAILLGPATSLNEEKPITKETPKQGPVVTTDQSYILRASAIDACELMVETAQSLDLRSLGKENTHHDWISKLTLPDLDMWIWAVAKDRSDYRSLERFVDQNTIYF
ncbi:hypothetical protein JR316_0002186 [Psilocybe cubensis]|uniref:Uncharacterized protein n=2 Tax=Psilocybe cubensis TaxID=181762 RepID=A0ACB8HC69_PSICU|nr:hypothetical protein JR316_0002186 [Psilocybe cubensis]KAH9485279.1 hypothetical protein JR316_0002186 [Psilocybe cubensis]